MGVTQGSGIKRLEYVWKIKHQGQVLQANDFGGLNTGETCDS